MIPIARYEATSKINKQTNRQINAIHLCVLKTSKQASIRMESHTPYSSMYVLYLVDVQVDSDVTVEHRSTIAESLANCLVEHNAVHWIGGVFGLTQNKQQMLQYHTRRYCGLKTTATGRNNQPRLHYSLTAVGQRKVLTDSATRLGRMWIGWLPMDTDKCTRLFFKFPTVEMPASGSKRAAATTTTTTTTTKQK